MQSAGGGVDFRTFLFPGVLAMSVLFTAAFSGISIVWDREFGFLREMLVAPVSTPPILAGKCLGGATVATLQSIVVLLLAGLVGVPYDPLMMLEMLVFLFLMSFMITALGAGAGQPRQAGAVGHAAGADDHHAADVPVGRAVSAVAAARLAVVGHPSQPDDLCRRAGAFGGVRPPPHEPEARAILDPGIVWGGWHVPMWMQLAIVVVSAVVLLVLAVELFARTE